MATVTGFTADRMKQIEDSTVVSGTISDGDLILQRRDGAAINAGNVRGPQGIQGPTGDVEDAPEDGKLFVRQNGTWYALATGQPPQNNITHGLKNGVWTEIELAVPPPNNGLRYAMRNGAWVRAAQPWALVIDNTTSPLPAGFTVGAITSAPYKVHISGSGYQVNYTFRFNVVASSDTGSLARFTFPTALRPNLESDSQAIIYSGPPGTSSRNGGVTNCRMKENGQFVINTGGPPVFYKVGPTNNPEIFQPTAGGLEQYVFVSGSYTRNTDELPPSAYYT